MKNYKIEYTQKSKGEPWSLLPNGFNYATKEQAIKAAEYFADDGSKYWKKISIYNKDGTLDRSYRFRIITVTQRERIGTIELHPDTYYVVVFDDIAYESGMLSHSGESIAELKKRWEERENASMRIKKFRYGRDSHL